MFAARRQLQRVVEMYYVNAGGQQVAGPVGLVEAYEIQEDLLRDDGVGTVVTITEDDPDEDDDDDDDDDDLEDD